MSDPDLILRLASLGVAALLAIAGVVAVAIRKGSMDGPVGFAVATVILGGFSVGAFGPAAVGDSIGLIVLVVVVLAVLVAI